MQQKERIDWIDSAKGIGLLFVIFGHLHIPYLATWIYFFHMPLFFFLSGAVYSGEKYPFRTYFNKRVRSLVVPYFSFGIIIWLFYVIVNCFVSADSRLYGSNMDMLKGLIIQEHFWTIWFLAALFFVEMIYYLMDRVFGKSMVGLSVASSFLCVFGLIRYRMGWGALPWNLDVAFVAQLFFHTGKLLRKSKFLTVLTCSDSKGRQIVLLLIFLVVSILGGGLGIKIAHESLDMSVGLYGNELLTFIAAFAGIFFVIVLSSLLPLKSLRYLGRNTMVIFALHSRVVIVLCNYIYAGLGIFQGTGLIERLSYAAVTFVVIMAVMIPLTELMKKSKVRTLFGVGT